MNKHHTQSQDRSTVRFENLESMVKEHVQGFLQDLLEHEVSEFLGRFKYERATQGVDKKPGHRNGYGKPRKLSTQTGTVIVRRPRVRDTEEKFESRLLPLFKRKTGAIETMLPELYLHGLSHGDFELALRGLLGDAAPLSTASLARLKAKWLIEYQDWKSRDLSKLDIVYWWVDGIYVKAGISDTKAALLVVIAADVQGRKHILAVEDGARESKESWAEVIRSITKRGGKLPCLTVGDGHLGIWSALDELHPEGKQQRCWNHKIVNILDAIPKKYEAEAKELLTQMPYCDTKPECENKKQAFIRRFKDIAPKAVQKLERDWERMVTFYSFPKEHWVHLRTTNIVESPFSTLRLRTSASRRYKKVENAVALMWKLLTVYEKRMRRLKGYELLERVRLGEVFENGLSIGVTRDQAA